MSLLLARRGTVASQSTAGGGGGGGGVSTADARSLWFHTTGDHVSIPTAVYSAIKTAGQATIELWFRNHDTVKSNRGLFVFGPNSDRVMWLGVAGTNLTTFTGYGTALSVASAFPSKTWVHVAIVIDEGTDWAVYLDGVEADREAFGTLPASTTIAEIGRLTSSWDIAEGQIADVRVWSTVRTATEIADNKDTFVDPASTGLVANWRFDSGPVAADSTSGGYDGTPSKTTITSTEVPFATDNAQSFLFDATDASEYMALPVTLYEAIKAAGQCTVEMWYRRTATDSNRGLVAAGANDERAFWLGGSGVDLATFTNNGTEISALNVYPLDTWVHVALTIDEGTDWAVFIDAVEKDRDTFGTLPATVSEFEIGRLSHDFQEAAGQIDEVRIWSTVRTASEISSNKDATISPSTTGLLAYYQFEDTLTGDIVADATANGHDGTLNGKTAITGKTPFA